MMQNVLIKLFKRDLNSVKLEINAYSSEANMWLLKDGINNSTGNLSLHIVGGLNHFIGAVIGNTGYVRKRDLEFSLKNVSRQDLINQLDDVELMIEEIVAKLSDKDLENTYPINVFKEPMTVGFFLTHLTTHLGYHLGQINYHRRLLDK
ncbi:hypothetical protein GCM10022291_03940 [Postechiella marina]|uniref:DinB-like domain-containing protein n=1 Tax=Postechiella marina TaxID=943941 RepID=A0ABP8C0C0_9FLAO